MKFPATQDRRNSAGDEKSHRPCGPAVRLRCRAAATTGLWRYIWGARPNLEGGSDVLGDPRGSNFPSSGPPEVAKVGCHL